MEVFDIVLGALKRCCAALPDKRTGDHGQYTMAEIGLSAFSLFFAQSPSFRRLYTLQTTGDVDASGT